MRHAVAKEVLFWGPAEVYKLGEPRPIIRTHLLRTVTERGGRVLTFDYSAMPGHAIPNGIESAAKRLRLPVDEVQQRLEAGEVLQLRPRRAVAALKFNPTS